jgi:hypothetical protein
MQGAGRVREWKWERKDVVLGSLQLSVDSAQYSAVSLQFSDNWRLKTEN